MSTSDITIIAGGWSVRDADLNEVRGLVIGVNDAAIHAPRCDITVSMDRLWTEWRWPLMKTRCRESWIRKAALKNINTSEAGDWLRPFDNDYESVVFSEKPFTLNGTNSGFCALNLAYQLRPERVFLFGFDMSRGPHGEPYWFPPYPWAPGGATKDGKYRAWAGQFTDARTKFDAAGIRVVNVTPSRSIQAFKRTGLRDPVWRR